MFSYLDSVVGQFALSTGPFLVLSEGQLVESVPAPSVQAEHGRASQTSWTPIVSLAGYTAKHGF